CRRVAQDGAPAFGGRTRPLARHACWNCDRRPPCVLLSRSGRGGSRDQTRSAGCESWSGSGTLTSVADFLSKEARSRVMSRIRSPNTRREMALRRELFRRGVRGWRCHSRAVPGKPDLAFTRCRIAVFVDGRFWHGHPDFFTPGKSGAYWDAKIARTKERDMAA